MTPMRLCAAAAATLIWMGSTAALAAEPLPNASPESLGFSAERLKRMDDRMAQVVADGEVAGMSTLVVRHGKVAAFRTHGVANLATGQPIRRDTIFRIYSMTKPITGVALMMLYEEGRLRLDDPIAKHIPEFKDLKVYSGRNDAAGKPILEPLKRQPTIRDLMSHQAGFTYGFAGNNPVDRMYAEKGVLQSKGLQQMIDRLATIPLAYQPGERWVYSVSVDVQGYLVEKLSGKPFGQFLQERVFGPLKMSDTGFHVPADKVSRLAAVYATNPQTGKLEEPSVRNGNPVADYTKVPDMESGGGGLVSTIDDYSRFAQMLANGGELDGARILAPATVELMYTDVLTEKARSDPNFNFNENVGFGLDFEVAVAPRRNGGLEGEGTMSWEGAAGTIFWTDPTNDVVYVGMIQNYSRAGPRNSLVSLARPLVYQALVDPSK